MRRAPGWIEIEIEIDVADSGISIAPEDLAKLFQPFVQLDAAIADARQTMNCAGRGLNRGGAVGSTKRVISR